jgi:hypothetical protein
LKTQPLLSKNKLKSSNNQKKKHKKAKSFRKDHMKIKTIGINNNNMVNIKVDKYGRLRNQQMIKTHKRKSMNKKIINN